MSIGPGRPKQVPENSGRLAEPPCRRLAALVVSALLERVGSWCWLSPRRMDIFFQAADGTSVSSSRVCNPWANISGKYRAPTVTGGQLDAQVLEVGGGVRPARVRQPGKTTPADRRRRFGASRLPSTPQGSEMRMPIYGSNP
jgi:hypothetical protein